MTFDERVRALRPLGLPPRQTAFLVTVALHGGYCVRRQYDAFAGRAHGQIVCDFFDLLVTRGLATPLLYQPNRGSVYHLHAKPIYTALAQPDNRNRRAASPAQIARKLMVLDYVLTAPTVEWLATEQDKVGFFTSRCGIAPLDLPQRHYAPGDAQGAGTTRYFVEKLPIALTADDPALRFVCLVRDESGAAFEQFLTDHLRLLSRVPSWAVVAVCPPHLDGLPACRSTFERFFGASRPALVRHDPTDLQWFCRARAAVDRGDLRALSVKDLDRFRELRRAFSGAAFEAAYVAWQREGDAALRNSIEPLPSASPSAERLITYILPNRYTQFGKLAGVA